MIRTPSKLVKSAKRTKYTTPKRGSKTKKRSSFPLIVWTGRYPVPLLLKNTGVYSDVVTLTLTTGIWNKYIWCCNGLYDPNTTGAGQQPLYFDQLMAIYDHYCVTGSKLKLTATSHPTTTTPQQVSVYIGDDASVVSTQPLTLMEQSSASATVSMLNGNTPKVLYKTWSVYNSFCKDPLAKDSLKGTSGANPTEQSTYIVSVNDVSGVGTTTTYFTAEIEFRATFFELTDIPGS